jgi:sigma-E factor negative regulatory protein RseB
MSLWLAAGAAASGCPEVDERALQWLDKMSHSLREISYQGVVTLQRGSEMQVMQVSHIVEEGVSSETLTELTGTGAQVQRTAHPLDCVHPGISMLRSAARDRSGHCGIAAQYRVSVTDGERVAGRNAVRVSIMPRDMYRFGHVLTLDRETGLLLKARTVHHGRKTLEVMQFAQVSYTDTVPPASPAAFIHHARHPDSDRPHSRYSVDRAWTVGWLPRGFEATDPALGTDGRRTYTDGLAVFSVFLEDLDQAMRPGEGLVKRGGTTTYTRGMHLSGRPVLVTVIGEVPENTARMVADSVSWLH